jgi:hypothetical protein
MYIYQSPNMRDLSAFWVPIKLPGGVGIFNIGHVTKVQLVVYISQHLCSIRVLGHELDHCWDSLSTRNGLCSQKWYLLAIVYFWQ